MNFQKWVKIIQTAGYNGVRTVYEAVALHCPKYEQNIREMSALEDYID